MAQKPRAPAVGNTGDPQPGESPRGPRGRRMLRIEILVFPDEKDTIVRRAGKVPVGRWGRLKLLGKRGPGPAPGDSVPKSRVIGFAETVERLALSGDLAAVVEVTRSLLGHLRSPE